MSERVRGALTGAALGLGVLLLLDLARILMEAIARDGGETSTWWPFACYLGVGLLVAYGVVAGRRDRLIPLVAGGLVLLVALPALFTDAAGWLPELPLVPATAAAQAVTAASLGALVYAAVRGS